MVRISLKEAYDDRSVIKKIADLEANKQNKLTAGQGVTIDGTTISVDTSDLATKAALNAEAARLDRKIDDVDAKIPPLASKEELNAQAARLDAKIERGDRDLSSRIDASDVKIKANADAILTIEDELGSDALPGTIYYRIAKVENDVITLKPLVNDSIKKVDVEGDASTVYHRALHNSGIVENDTIPVASDTKAGVMSAGMYVGFNGSIQNLQARMSVLEGVGITYQLTGLPDNATSEQITAAFQAQYPNVPLMAGIRAADYDKAKIWQYSGTAWIQLTSININVATSSALGLVKGSETSTTNDGKIFVEVDGSMTVIGWDTLKALASAAKQSVDNLEPKVTQQSAKIVALEDDVAANAADITALQGTSANHESRISSLETTSADLRTRMGTAETDIDTLQSSDSQQTSKISALEADMNNVKPRVGQLESDVGTLETKVDQHTQSISGLSTEVNGLKTSKQDKLIAGSGITIADDGRTISTTGGNYTLTPINSMTDLINSIRNASPGDEIIGDCINQKGDTAILFPVIEIVRNCLFHYQNTPNTDNFGYVLHLKRGSIARGSESDSYSIIGDDSEFDRNLIYAHINPNINELRLYRYANYDVGNDGTKFIPTVEEYYPLLARPFSPDNGPIFHNVFMKSYNDTSN